MNAPPPPPPSYASATQEIGGGYSGSNGYAPQPQNGGPIHSPTRRGPPVTEGDGFSESIDPAKYKTRLCQAYIMGTHCTFGARCAFAHGNSELRHHSTSSPTPAQLPPAPQQQQQQQAPPPPPSYNDFHHQHFSAGPSSPLHSRPQTPRGAPTSGGGTADGLLSPTRGVHPRNSLPGSPVTAGDQMVYPTAATQRFRNEPYSPTGFVFQGTNGGEGDKQEQ
jgi:hypothetical protein